ncbi:MAG: hypothetical protein ACOVNU_05865 [Candidatus Kapaibacteriota bacterium]
MSLQNGFTILRAKSIKHLMKRIETVKGNAYIRQGSFATDIIWQGRKFIFPNPKKSANNNIWIFRAVIMDVKKHLLNHKIREKKKLPVNNWNLANKTYKGDITATDIDHAYWRIAFLNEYISIKTYLKGLELKDKSLRLASLANLSSIKEYKLIKDGVLSDEKIVLKYDPILHKVYNNIRFSCYEYMVTMAEMLGDDFICYKTDCIYYKDTEENRLMIQNYLDSVAMEWKQLIEPPMPTKEEVNKSIKQLD